MKYFYKIKNNELIIGTGYKIPDGFIEYDRDNPPQDFLDLLKKENLENAKKQKTKELNNIRNKKLKNLKVKFILQDGQEAEFDADEISQTRLARAISALKDSEKIAWIGADYKVYKLTKEDCLSGLRIAGELQTKLFAKCAELKAKILQAQTEEEIEAVKWEG